jgi:hypothetical protein
LTFSADPGSLCEEIRHKDWAMDGDGAWNLAIIAPPN